VKATRQLKQGLIEVEGDTQPELFKAIASAVEVFDEAKCGLCGCEDILPVVRKNKDGDDFFEYQCRGLIKNQEGKTERCRAYLYLGQNKDKKAAGLFPVRALDEKGKPDRTSGKYGRHNGWTRYRGEPKPQK
jgi:hypothetical protein